MMHIPNRKARDRAETALVPENAAVLAAIRARGRADTDQLHADTRQPLGALTQRLQRLKRVGLVRIVARRSIARSNGKAHVGVWALATARAQRQELDPAHPYARALRITIGRGARWGAGLV